MGSGISRRDGEWLDLVVDLMSGPTTTWPDQTVTRMLVLSLDATAAVFNEQAGPVLLHRSGWPPDHFTPYLEELQVWTQSQAGLRHPLLRYHATTGLDTCLQVDDVPSGIADARMMADWRARGRRWGGAQSQISLPVRFGPAGVRSFVVARPERSTAQEMHGARRVHRLLQGLDRHLDGYRTWSTEAAPDAVDAAASVALIPRELVVLDLLSRSLTAAAIGRRLAIAERTVQKHLQRIYRKLGAVDRLDAVRRAEYLGLVQPPSRTQFPALPPR